MCPGRARSAGLRAGVDGRQDRARAVGRGDPGGRALLGLDGHAERGAEARAVLAVLDHERDAQVVQPVAGHGQADQPAPVGGHEVDHVGGDVLGGNGEVALVLAVLVVHHHHHAALADVRDGLRDGAERARLLRLPALPRVLSRRLAVQVVGERGGDRFFPEAGADRGSHGDVPVGHVLVLHSSPCFSVSVATALPSSWMNGPTAAGFVVCDWLAHTSLFWGRL